MREKRFDPGFALCCDPPRAWYGTKRLPPRVATHFAAVCCRRSRARSPSRQPTPEPSSAIPRQGRGEVADEAESARTKIGDRTRGKHAPIPKPKDLLPLDGPGRLRRDVEDHSVDLADLVDHAGSDALEKVVGQAGPVGCHGVVAGDGSDDDDIAVGALVALDAGGAEVSG